MKWALLILYLVGAAVAFYFAWTYRGVWRQNPFVVAALWPVIAGYFIVTETVFWIRGE